MNPRLVPLVRGIAAFDALLLAGLSINFVAVNGRENAMLMVVFLPLLALYGGILWCLRAGPSRAGLKLAMIAGAAAAVLLFAVALFLLVTVVVIGISEPRGGDSAKEFAVLAGVAAGIALLAWMQWAMYQNAKKAHEAQWPEIELKRGARWITALSILVGTGALFVIAVALPGLLRSRIAANESSAVGSLRSINTACVTYSSTYGGFPPSLVALGPPGAGAAPSAAAADLLDPTLAVGTKSRYTFTYTSGAAVAGRIPTYTINADPVTPGTTGQRFFFTDQSGVVRADPAAKATVASTPI